MKDQIKERCLNFKDFAIDFRRTLHRCPELSFQEEQTALRIQEQLEQHHISYRKNVGGNGIVAVLEGKNPDKKAIALRADFDALPLEEKTNLPFASQNKGVMHACGHDFHTACLLAATLVLDSLKNLWEGRIYCIFQHAEELVPGGAKAILNDHPFEFQEPEYIIAQHVEPNLPVGTFGFKKGKYMASNDEIYLNIKGQGGHGALPHTINDTVLAASQTIVSLQQITSRIVPATLPCILSFGRMIANGATNVIPNEVNIAGTFRIFDESWRKKVHQHIQRIAEHTAEAYGVKCEVEIRHGYPVVENNDFLVDTAKAIIQDTENTKSVDLEHRMTSEDFAYFTQKYKSLFFRTGVGHSQKELNHPLHSELFNLNETAFDYALPFLVELSLNLLK